MRTRLGSRGAPHPVGFLAGPLAGRRATAAGGVVRSLLGSLALLACFALGLLIAWATTAEFARTIASRSWPATDCLILSSGVEVPAGGGQEFLFRAEYRYRAGGTVRTGDVVRPGYDGSGDSADAYRMAAAYPAGARVTCWVDPERPGDAFLEHRSLWHGLVILASLPFLGGGAGGLWLLWGGRRRKQGGAPAPSPAEALGRKWTGGSSGCLAAFFSVFLFAGLGFLWLTLLGPGLGAWRARSWVATPCEVVSSHVETHPSDEGDPTYSVEILYRYRIDGREYHSNRYHFHTGSTGGYEGKAAVVERLPAGSRFTCWVDPGDPSQAVIERGLGREAWIGLVPMIFVIVGGGGIVFALTGHRRQERRARKGAGARAAAAGYAAADDGVVVDGARVLEPAQGPWTRLLVLIFVAAFWNGITGIFVWQAVEGWRAGAPDGCLTLFILPFVGIGLLLLVSVPYSILALANPRPRLILTPGRLPPGGRAEISWRFTGAARRIRRLRIKLDAEESISTGSGKSRSTKTTPLHTQTLVETELRSEIEHGNAAFVLAPDAPPTSSEGDARVTWKLKLRGEIRLWPDVNEEFEITVPGGGRKRPKKPTTGKSAAPESAAPTPSEPPPPAPPADPGPPIPPPDEIWTPPPAPLPGTDPSRR